MWPAALQFITWRVKGPDRARLDVPHPPSSEGSIPVELLPWVAMAKLQNHLMLKERWMTMGFFFKYTKTLHFP